MKFPSQFIDIDENRTERTRISVYSICHVRDYKNRNPGTIEPEVQDLSGKEYQTWDRPSTLAKFIATQAQEPTAQQYATCIGLLDSKCNIDGSELLVRQSITGSSIQTVVPKVVQARLLFPAQNPSLAEQPGDRKMHDAMILK